MKKSNGTLYWTGPGWDPLLETDLSGNATAEYVFFNGKRVARVDMPGNSPKYYFEDHLGSTDIVTNPTGGIVEESDYVPYGGEVVISGSDPNHFKFTGKERDTESGLDYFDARHYSSPFGRFMTPDWAATATAVPYANFGNPQSLNLYSYVQNNPTTIGDPDGHDPCGCGYSLTTVYPGWDAFVERYVDAAKQVAQQDAKAISNAVQKASDAIQESGFGKGAMAGPDPIPGMGDLLFSKGQETAHSEQPAQPGDGGTATPSGPQEPYDRDKHYGKTPTASDKAAVGGESVDHDPPLVKRYYEGDAKAGEKPGHQQTPQERRSSAQDRTRMKPSTNQQQRSQGGHMSHYSKQMKKKHKL